MPRLELQALIAFLIDSGADNTTLSLIDVERMNLDYRYLRRGSSVPVQGIAGEQRFYSEQALCLFRDEEGKTYAFQINAHIPKKGTASEANQQRMLPSVLGRDVLNQCKMTIDFHNGIVELLPPEGARLPQAMRRLL